MIQFSKIYERYDLIETLEKFGLEVVPLGSGYSVEECPFCGGHDCFRIYADGTKWSCFQCPDDKINRDVIDFIAYTKDVSISKVLHEISEELDLDLEEDDPVVFEILSLAEKYYKDKLLLSLDKPFKVINRSGKKVKMTLREYYLEYRGVHIDDVLDLDIGFSDGLLCNDLKLLGYSEKQIVRAGLSNRNEFSDYFPANSTIFFHKNKHSIVGFSCDSGLLRKNIPLKSKKDYSISESEFFMQETISKQTGTVFVVEGQWDAISLIPILKEVNDKATVIATTGKINSKQLNFLAELNLPIVELFDNDSAGRVLRNTLLNHKGINNLIDIPPESFGSHKDINDIISLEKNPLSFFKSMLNKACEPVLYKIQKEKTESVKKDNILEVSEDELYNVDLELAILKKIFYDKDISKVLNLNRELFYVKAHKRVFDFVKSSVENLKTLDLNLLVEQVNLRDELVDSIKEADDIISLDDALEVLLLYYEKREIKESVSSLNSILKKSKSVPEFRKACLSVSEKIISSSFYEEDSVYTSENIDIKADLDIPDEGIIPGMSGFDNLDSNFVFGFYPGQINLIAGRPGSGKSMFKINMIKNQCEDLKYGVLSFTPENGNILDLARLDSLMLGIPFNEIITAKKDSDIYVKRQENWEHIKKNWVFFQSSELVSVQYIIMNLLNFRIKYPNIEKWFVYIDMIDYLEELDVTDNRWFIIGKILTKLRVLSKPENLNFALIPLVHISRDASKKLRKSKDRRPSLHDLRGSGAFENLSDLVLLVHRESMYSEEVEDDVMEIIIAKQRAGISNLVSYFRYEADFSRVVQIDDYESMGELNDVDYSSFEMPDM